MKKRNRFQLGGVQLLLLLIVAVAAIPVVAQEPEGEEEGVNAQAAAITGPVTWNPTPMNVPLGGPAAINRVLVDGAEQVWGVTLSIGYDANILTPGLEEIEPGSVVPGQKNVDYLWTSIPFPNPPPVGHCANLIAGVTTPAAFTINIAFFGSGAGPIEGSGSLVEIPWTAHNGGATTICIDGTSQVVDQFGNGVTIVPPANQNITVIAGNNTFRIGLQGGKAANFAPGASAGAQIPAANQITLNTPTPCILPAADANPPVANLPECTPLDSFPLNIHIERPGYLDVDVTFDTAADVRSVYMLAGDIDDDDKVSILDLSLIAGSMYNANLPFVYNGVQDATLERMDFTGPGNVPDGNITIQDLVLAALNYNKEGPTEGFPPQGISVDQ